MAEQGYDRRFHAPRALDRGQDDRGEQLRGIEDVDSMPHPPGSVESSLQIGPRDRGPAVEAEGVRPLAFNAGGTEQRVMFQVACPGGRLCRRSLAVCGQQRRQSPSELVQQVGALVEQHRVIRLLVGEGLRARLAGVGAGLDVPVVHCAR